MRVDTAHAQQVRERAAERDDERRSDADGDPVWVGVVRSPPGWFNRRVDVSYSALGLPPTTRESLERRRRDLRMQGLCAEGAHNAAWEELEVDDAYRASLSDGPTAEARAALDDLSRLVDSGDVVLATDRRPGFRCHRTVLASVLDGEG